MGGLLCHWETAPELMGSGDPGKLHSLFQFLEKVQAGTFLAPLGFALPVLLATL